MGLGDVYNNVPDSFSGQAGRQVGQAFQSLPALQQSSLQAQGMQQANQDAAYNSPAREANPQERDIGNFYRQLIGHGDPNTPPGFAERFHSELTDKSGGLGQGVQPQSQPPTQPSSPSSMPMASSGLSSGPAEPQSRPQPQVQQGLSAPPSRDFAMSMPQSLGRQQPMTQGDVEKYMRLAPELRQRTGSSGLTYDQRLALEEAKTENTKEVEGVKGNIRGGLEEKKGGIKGGLQAQGEKAKAAENVKIEKRKWQEAIWHEDRMRNIEAKIRTGSATALEVAQLKAATARYTAEIGAIAKQVSSIPELAGDEDLKAQTKELQRRSQQMVIGANKMSVSDSPTSTNQSSSVRVKGPQGSQSNAALDWANAHPNDPRSILIKKKLGL